MSTTERIALCPGSFDPITLGHEDIARRALAVADRVVVAVAHSATQQKRGMFDVDERVELIDAVFADEPRIEAAEFQGLLVDYARERGASIVIRGLRSVADYEYEFQMARMNRALYEGMETIFLAADPKHTFVSSTLIRQIATLDGDISKFVSPAVQRAIGERTI